MSIIRFLRFIFGYVEFCAEGGFPERFINLCSVYHVRLWDVTVSYTHLTLPTNSRV